MKKCPSCKRENQLAAEVCRFCGQQQPALGHVMIIDADMPFWSMVGFMVKWALAAVPAILILFLVATFLGAMFAAWMHH